jgi:kynurenine formamidase
LENSKLSQLLGLISKDIKLIDLTHTFEEGMPVWPTHPRYFKSLCESYEFGDPAYFNQISFGEHNGTHIDSPGHFVAKGKAHYFVDKLKLKKLFGRACIINIPKMFGEKHLLDKKMICEWEKQNGPLEKDDIVLIRFGVDKSWGLRHKGDNFLKSWGGLSKDGAEYLLDRCVAIVGTDALSIDASDNGKFEAHHVLLENEILILENLTNLDLLPPITCVIALPLKFKGGSGSPVRAVALVPKN